MAKNKITHEWNEDGTAIIFTGSQMDPAGGRTQRNAG